MHGTRILFAALMFVAVTLGASLHGVAARGVAGSGAHAVHSAHVAAEGLHCRPDHHGMSGLDAACQLACEAAIPILGSSPRMDTRPAYAVQFASSVSAAGRGVTPVLEPFPPRPFDIA